jgi:hypothetical protein
MVCNRCDKCYGFIVDFISIPVDYPLSHYVKSKNIPKVADKLAKEFYRIFQTITSLEHYFIACKYLHSFHIINHIDNNITPENVRGMIKLEALCDLPHKDTIHYIIFILEENSIIINHDIQLLWIANCLEHLWMHLENIHNEHTGKVPVSYGGPPIGISPNKKVNIPEKTQEEKEFDELYN